MKDSRGFTMVELMIVVAIIGILFVFAIPSYQSYLLQAHRADAQGVLLNISAREERFVAQNNTYTTELSAGTGLGMGTTTSPEGYYTLAVAFGATGSLLTSYVITATAVGGQANDTGCTSITYSSAGVKGPTADCW